MTQTAAQCHRTATADPPKVQDGPATTTGRNQAQRKTSADARRTPVPPPPAIASGLSAARSTGRPAALLDGAVTAYPPTTDRRTWRVVHRVGGRRVERSAGRDAAQVWAAVLACQEDLLVAARPLSATSVSGLVEAYVQQHEGRWDVRTVHDRGVDLGGLRRFGHTVPCHRLDRSLLQRAVDACGTPRRGEFVRRRIRHLLAWG